MWSCKSFSVPKLSLFKSSSDVAYIFSKIVSIFDIVFSFGPSEKVLSENEEVKKLFLKISKEGNFTPVACINVANHYGIKEKLESLNITLTPIGADVTKAVNADYVPMTF